MARYTYVISDIHGEFDAFMKMMTKINFSYEDELYILGDVIDRGNKSIECIQWIMEQDNVLTILGNHELLFYDNYMNNTPSMYNAIQEVKEKLSILQQKEIISWIESMPECKIIIVNKQKFYLCHTQIPTNDYFKKEITDRLFPDYSVYKDYYNKEINNIICIHGHIPTMQMRKWNNQNKDNTIWKNKNKSIIDIDCGAAYSKNGGCLGCLRLNDLKEFYVDLPIR